MPMNPLVTILMPCRNEERFIEQTFQTILAQDFPADQTEVLVMDGVSSDRTPEILARLQREHSNIRVIENPRRLQSHAMNIGIREARGEYIVRMDAHTLYGPDYVRQCVELLNRGDAAEVGGVQRAVGTGYLTNAIAEAMCFPFGVGDARFRYTECEIYGETVYLGAWKRQTLLDLGGFLNEVNEEGEFNYRLRKAGHRILVSPRIRLKYLVRQSLLGLAHQYAYYGQARIQTLVRYPDSVLFRQLVPPLLVISLVLSAAAYPISIVLGLAVPASYLAANATASLVLASRKGLKYLALFPIIFAVMHLSWGLGFFVGMTRFGVPRVSLRALWRSLVSRRQVPAGGVGSQARENNT